MIHYMYTWTKSVTWSASEKKISQINIFRTVNCFVQFISSSNSEVKDNLDENIDDIMEDRSTKEGPLTLYLIFLSESPVLIMEVSSFETLHFCWRVSLLKIRILNAFKKKLFLNAWKKLLHNYSFHVSFGSWFSNLG